MLKQMLAVCSFLALVGTAFAQPAGSNTSSYQPKLRDTLLATISKVEGGECPAALMSPMVQYACQQQLAAAMRHLQQFGDVKEAQFMGLQQQPGVPIAEAYRVQFDRGEMQWFVAADQSGRLIIFYTPS